MRKKIKGTDCSREKDTIRFLVYVQPFCGRVAISCAIDMSIRAIGTAAIDCCWKFSAALDHKSRKASYLSSVVCVVAFSYETSTRKIVLKKLHVGNGTYHDVV
jgi:hypothetical protein